MVQVAQPTNLTRAMMAPEASEAAAPAPALQRTAPPGVSGSGTAAPEGRATLRWPFRTREQQELAQQRAAKAAKSESEPESEMESDNESSQSADGRERNEQVESDSGESSQQSSDAVLPGQEPQQNQAGTEADAVITAETIPPRASKMFAVGASGVAASGLPRLAPEPTKGIVKYAAAHMEVGGPLKKTDVDALSNSFGNFDRVVGLGWLIADCVRPVGAPLLERKEAHAVGLKAARAADRIKKDVRTEKLAIQRQACKLSAEDPERKKLEQQAEGVEAALLRAIVDVALPPLEAPPARSSATGSRKRGREAAEPSLDQRVAAAEDTVLQTEKAVKRTEAALTRAETHEREAEGKASGLLDRLQGESSQQSVDRAHAAMDRWHMATLESREAESDLWEARYHGMHAEAVSLDLQLERAWALGARQEKLYQEQVAALKEQLAAYRDMIGALKGRVAELEGPVDS